MIGLSIIIPTYNRPDLLAACLECVSLERQGVDPASWEVIVTDASVYPRAEQMLRTRFPWVTWRHAPGLGPGANRNAAARAATGDWVVFLDDDCLPARGWLSAIVPAAEDGIDVVEGRTTVPDERDNPFYYAPYNHHGGLYWTCNLAVRRAAFERLGGFDEDFVEQCEDMDFARRIARARLRTLFAPAALVWHPMRRIGWRGIVQAMLRSRWHVMYALKDSAAALEAHPAVAATAGVARAVGNLLRTTAHLITRPDRAHWRTKWFWVIWRWLTFPLVLPYLIFWELRFRRMLVHRRRTARL